MEKLTNNKKQAILRVLNSMFDINLFTFRERFAKISVYFRTLETTELKEIPVYPVESFWGELTKLLKMYKYKLVIKISSPRQNVIKNCILLKIVMYIQVISWLILFHNNTWNPNQAEIIRIDNN